MKKLWKGMFMTPHLWESIYIWPTGPDMTDAVP